MSNPPAGQETPRTETELERIVHKQRPIIDSGTAFILMTKFARNLERELAAAKAQLAEALESERLKLAACGVAALQNTPESAKERLTRDNPYWTASYGDVCHAVDQQMELRAQLSTARQEALTMNKEYRRLKGEIARLKSKVRVSHDLKVAAETRAHDSKLRAKTAEYGLRGLLQRCTKAEASISQGYLTGIEDSERAAERVTPRHTECGNRIAAAIRALKP